MNIFLFISFALGFTFLIGKVLEKIRVPWIFAALIFGGVLALHNPFTAITSSESFSFLADLGMYFLLFIVGFEINIRKMRKQGGFILRSSFAIILFEALLGTVLIHFLFTLPWLVSVLVAVSFATVGEAVLVPILDKLDVINTKLGQLIIGIGSFDDIIEIATLLAVTMLVGVHLEHNIVLVLVSLVLLIIMTVLFTRLSIQGERFRFLDIETLFLLVIFVFFLFIGVGVNAEAAPLAALLAGVSLRTFIPHERRQLVEREIKTWAYGLFAPIFFLWVGVSIDLTVLWTHIHLVVLLVVVTAAAKLLASIVSTKSHMKLKESILLGTGLSVRFSTGIVIVKIFLDAGLIGDRLYSVIIASSILFTLLVPMIFSYLLYHWRKHVTSN